MKIVIPPLKSQGIKTRLVPLIKTKIENEIKGIWIEPFMGSGVVGFNIRPKKAMFSDNNPHIVNFYNGIKNGVITPESVQEFLQIEGTKLEKGGVKYYERVRTRFNKTGESLDFLFLNRSCFNGIMRFNSKGGYNVPFCHNPKRFAKSHITKITNQVKGVAELIRDNDYTFICANFEKAIENATEYDMIYCDPPYIDRSSDYYNTWRDPQEISLFEHLDKVGSRFIMSTWHHSKYRANTYIGSYWCKFNVTLQEHHYHVGGKIENRNSITEALITNF